MYLSKGHHHRNLAPHTVAKDDSFSDTKLAKQSFHIVTHAVIVHLGHVWTAAMVSDVNGYHLKETGGKSMVNNGMNLTYYYNHC